MNISNTVVITKPVIVEPVEETIVEPIVEEIVVDPVVEEVIVEEPVVEEPIVEPVSYAVVYWTLTDDSWTYMDTYYYDESTWLVTTPTDLQNKQVAQYVSWREYCQSPVTKLSEITSTTIEEVI